MKKALVLATLGAIALSTTVLAHKGATGVVKQRMMAMTAIADEIKLVASMLRGKQAFDTKTISSGAAIIQSHAQKLTALFPAGSLDKPTTATPAIWEKPEEFTRLTEALAFHANALAESAQFHQFSQRHQTGLYCPDRDLQILPRTISGQKIKSTALCLPRRLLHLNGSG